MHAYQRKSVERAAPFYWYIDAHTTTKIISLLRILSCIQH